MSCGLMQNEDIIQPDDLSLTQLFELWFDVE